MLGHALLGHIAAAHGKRFGVVTEDGQRYDCVIRGKQGGVACHDAVEITPIGATEGVIERILPRRNLLYRSDELRSKLIAANVDLAVLVVAASPAPLPELLDRCLIATEIAAGVATGVTPVVATIEVLIVINKADLPETKAYAEQLQYYARLGYRVLSTSAHGDLSALKAHLKDRVSVLVGASGVGKSTLLNALCPEANAVTGTISTALDAGRHTTTHTRSHALPGGGLLIDSPGMQAFGLAHLTVDSLTNAFPEFTPLIGQCRFYNCRHLKEPGCAITAAVEAGTINRQRWRLYRTLREEVKAG
ncbi:MAG: ribosome small subunit-dependent GTPase A [Betaproteobacteria bacterium]|nr:MAG: ribosome small subunit-dependent GTPase A [Betaproteobacteria bacterium]